MRAKRKTVVIGGQYGSEGKGAVTRYLASEYGCHVRVGSSNAGHTIYHEGTRWVMRQVPCGWVNPDALLLIGPGAIVDRELLVEEVQALELAGYDIRSRLTVDKSAWVLNPAARTAEGGVNGEGHRKIGSTGEGVGTARLARVGRGFQGPDAMGTTTVGADDLLPSAGITAGDTSVALYHQPTVLVEAAQGFGLSLYHGDWPYVTSQDTTAAQATADAGLSPVDITDVVMVLRTFPIRVAGASGPLWGETTFEEIGVPPEHTSVTKKMRRIGRFDWDLFARATRVNRPTGLAVMFGDYLSPQVADATSAAALEETNLQDLLTEVGSHAPVWLVGTGPQTIVDLRGAA